MQKKQFRLGGLIAIVMTLLVLGVYAVTVGSQEDPLVSKSYLEETYTDELMEAVEDKLATRNAEVLRQVEEKIATAKTGGTAEQFALVTLKDGQTLTGTIGCEVLLRVGSATCVATSAPGLVDCTVANTINQGTELQKNHLYLMTIENRGVKAVGEVKLMVRGTYQIA